MEKITESWKKRGGKELGGVQIEKAMNNDLVRNKKNQGWGNEEKGEKGILWKKRGSRRKRGEQKGKEEIEGKRREQRGKGGNRQKGVGRKLQENRNGKKEEIV